MIEIKITAIDANEAHSEMRKLLGEVHITGAPEPTVRTASEVLAAEKKQFEGVDLSAPLKPMVDALAESVEDIDDGQLEFDLDEPKEVPQPEPVAAPKKRSRAAKKTKAKVVVDNTTDSHVGKMEQASKPVVDAVPEEPKNFYNESDFKHSFVRIMSDLVKNGTITPEYIDAKAKYYGVQYIFTIDKDDAKVLHFFETLVNEGKITRKANY